MFEPIQLKIGNEVYVNPKDLDEKTYEIFDLEYAVNEGYKIDFINWQGNEDYLKSKVFYKEADGPRFKVSTRALRENITVQIYVSKDTGDTAVNYDDDLDRLEGIYRDFPKSRYSQDNWEKLKGIYYKAVQDIKNSKSKAERNRIISKASYDMGQVEKLGKDEFGTVHVTVRNDTFTSDEAAFKGLIVDQMVPLEKDDTMMKAILKALDSSGFTWRGTGGDTPTDTKITYLASIQKDGKELGEFDGGASSGWMGTLNDWFTNEGFAQFGVENRKLSDGDKISVEYTCELGRDIRGGFEGSIDTALFGLNLSNGSMSPNFGPDIKDYYFVLDEGETTTTIDYSARTRSFPARAYLNKYNKQAKTWVVSGDNIPVQEGDTIYVVVGEPSWPSMGKGSPTMYRINIATKDSSNLATKRISYIPNITYSNYKEKLQDVKDARHIYDRLSDEAKGRVRDYERLKKAEERIELYQKLDDFKQKLSDVKDPANLNDEDEANVVDIINQYDSLESLQKDALQSLEISKVDSLKKWVDANHNKYKLVIDKIKAIGTVTLEKENQIKDAREAYELLPDAQKKLVTNYKSLVDAEKQILKLKDQEELAEFREASKAELEGYRNADDYRDAEKKALADAVNQGKDSIEKAETKADVENALAKAKVEIDKIKTDAQITELEKKAAKAVDDMIDSIEEPITVETKNQIDEAREAYEKLTEKEKVFVEKLAELEAAEEAYKEALKTQEFAKVKDALKKQLEEYKNLADYRDAEKKKLAEEIEKGKSAIDKTEDADAANKAFDTAKEAIDSLNLKTAAEYEQEELADFKETSQAELESYKNAEDYREAEKKVLATAIKKGKDAIEQAETKADVENALAKAKAEIDKIKTDAQLKSEAKRAAKNVQDLIKQATEKPILFDSSEKIKNADDAYNKLSDEAKKIVKDADDNNLEELNNAKADLKKASKVLKFINTADNNKGANRIQIKKDNAYFVEGKADDIIFELDTDFMNFDKVGKVLVDGKEIRLGRDYDARKGSVIITFKESFLNNLTVGRHVAQILTKDGYGEVELNVQKVQNVHQGDSGKTDTASTHVHKNNQAAKTGDSNESIPYASIIIAATVAALFMRRRAQK